MFSNYKRKIEVGKEVLDPDMKRERIEHKSKMLRGEPETDNDILNNAMNSRYRGPIDPGALTD